MRAQAHNTSAAQLKHSFLSCANAASWSHTVLLVLVPATPLLLGVLIYSVYPLVLRRQLRPLRRDTHPWPYESADAELRTALNTGRDRVGLLIRRRPLTAAARSPDTGERSSAARRSATAQHWPPPRA